MKKFKPTVIKTQVTNQKRKVVKMYVDGYTFKAIGEHLEVSTVRVHKIWHDMVRYCAVLNNWSLCCMKLSKKDFIKAYGKAMCKTLSCYKV